MRDGGRDGTDRGLGSCRVVSLHDDGDALLVLLEAAGRDLLVTVPLPPAAAEALEHVYALHDTGGHGCGAEVHVDLLVRSVRAAGSWPLCLLVRPDPEPAFWLRVMATGGPVDVDVGPLDAAALLLSERFPVGVVSTGADPLQDTLDRLLEGRRE